MAIVYKKGEKIRLYKKKSKSAKEKEDEKKNALSEFSKKMNHRSSDYQLNKVPYIQTK